MLLVFNEDSIVFKKMRFFKNRLCERPTSVEILDSREESVHNDRHWCTDIMKLWKSLYIELFYCNVPESKSL